MIKAFVPALVIASVLAAPTFAFTQDSNAPVMRAQVRSELVQLDTTRRRIAWTIRAIFRLPKRGSRSARLYGLRSFSGRYVEFGCAARQPEYVGS